MKKVGKNLLIVIAILITLACFSVIGWYGYISVYGAEKLVVNTIYGNTLTDSEGNTKHIWEINYYTNANKNGLECFEMALSGMTDISNTDAGIYTQGMQYIADNVNSSIEWFDVKDIEEIQNKSSLTDVDKEKVGKYKSSIQTLHTSSSFLWQGKYRAVYVSPFIENGASRYNYQKLASESGAYLGSTNPITKDSVFTIKLGEGEESESLNMTLMGDYHASYDSATKSVVSDQKQTLFTTKSSIGAVLTYYDYYFYDYNIDTLAYMLFNSVKTLPAGTNTSKVFEFGDYFKYYHTDNYQEINSDDTLKVINKIKSYYSIKVNISADGMTNANQSIFGVMHGSANYSVDGDTSNEYFTGKNVLVATNNCFDKIKVDGNYIVLKLREDFLNAYLPYKKSIKLHVKIDETEFTEQGYTFLGFANDSGLDNFDFELVEVA